jgi:hypothetical protein
MSFFDRAMQVAGQAAGRAREELDVIQTRLELDKAYRQLGKAAFELVDAGELTRPELTEAAERIRALRAQLSDKPTP